MATIKEVVEMWDETHSNRPEMQIVLQDGEKTKRGGFYGRLRIDAVIKLSDNYPYEPWPERICYIFSFYFDEQNNEITKIRVSFERRIKEDPNTKEFYKFLDEKFGKKFTLSEGKINPDHLVLKREFAPTSSAKDICDNMEELIELTQKPICEFL